MKQFRFLDSARVEIFEISAYYEAQALGLGDEFLTVLTAAVSLLREGPDLGAPHRADTHRFVLPRFPYSLIYLNDPEFLVVVAVAHHRREPEYWIQRL